MNNLLSKEMVLLVMFILSFVDIFSLIILLSYSYSDKAALKLTDLRKEDLDSKDLIKYLIFPFFEEEKTIYGQTKLKYLRKIIIYQYFFLMALIILICFYFIMN